MTRFITRTSKDRNGEKAVDSYFLNEDLIDEKEKYDGFYAIAANLDISAHPQRMRNDVEQILTISAQRYKIEDCFRLLSRKVLPPWRTCLPPCSERRKTG